MRTLGTSDSGAEGILNDWNVGGIEGDEIWKVGMVLSVVALRWSGG